MFSYIACRLTIHSELPLPELALGGENADATVRLGEIPIPPGLDAPPGACVYASSHEVMLSWEEAGKFLVQGGERIIIEPAPGVADEILRLYLLGPVLAVLLHQRGFLVLHASGVSIAGAAAAFLGASGWGKSTLAAALHAQGCSLLADDVVAVDTQGDRSPLVIPGVPQLKLWPQAVDWLGEQSAVLHRLHPALEKQGLPLHQDFVSQPQPLRWVFILQDGDQPQPQIEPLPVQDALVELIRHSFTARLLRRTEMAAHHLKQCSRLIASAQVCRLVRRRQYADFKELVSFLLSITSQVPD